jgi:hypothetical protein
MQKGFENGKCTHCKEEIPVGAVFGLVFLDFTPVSFLKKVLGQLAHRVVGQFYNDQS